MPRFRETLSDDERHLVERLESFGDVVIGFSLSLLSLSLLPDGSHPGLAANWSHYVLFFGTFAVVVSYWMRLHHIMSVGFRPRPFDLFALFTFLAFVILLPFAMQLSTHNRAGFSSNQQSVEFYSVVLLGVSVPGLILNIRGARNAWNLLDEPAKLKAWERVLVGVIVVASFASALLCAYFNQLAGALAVAIAMGVMLRLAKIFFRQPHPQLLGIKETAAA